MNSAKAAIASPCSCGGGSLPGRPPRSSCCEAGQGPIFEWIRERTSVQPSADRPRRQPVSVVDAPRIAACASGHFACGRSRRGERRSCRTNPTPNIQQATRRQPPSRHLSLQVRAIGRRQPSAISIVPILRRFSPTSVSGLIFDGQTLRIEFGVTRLDEVRANTPLTGRRYPASRIVLPPAAAVDLINRMQQIAAALRQAGVVKAASRPGEKAG